MDCGPRRSVARAAGSDGLSDLARRRARLLELGDVAGPPSSRRAGRVPCQALLPPIESDDHLFGGLALSFRRSQVANTLSWLEAHREALSIVDKKNTEEIE